MTVTRFAPSPTGYIHVGNLRTALFNLLIARKAGGTFILRLDDTDPERSKEEYVDAIKEDLEWLGLTWDRVERQSSGSTAMPPPPRGCARRAASTRPSRRRASWTSSARSSSTWAARRSMTAPRSASTRRRRTRLRAERGPGVWRFKLDQERIEWADGILGDVSIDAASVSDPVLIRGDGQVLYTLASVVDDAEMGVTHVVRGSDHVTNTATQIQIIGRARRHGRPDFAHHSLLTGPQGEALSKRLGTLSLRDLRARGAGADGAAVADGAARLVGPGGAARIAGRADRGLRRHPVRRRADQVRRRGPEAADRPRAGRQPL